MAQQKILVVDDDPTQTKLLGELLANAGYSVDLAYDGYKAIKLAASSDHSLAIIDFVLPGIQGLELLAILRLITPKLKAILMTGFDLETLGTPPIDSGVIQVLNKPVELEQLLSLIRQGEGE